MVREAIQNCITLHLNRKGISSLNQTAYVLYLATLNLPEGPYNTSEVQILNSCLFVRAVGLTSPLLLFTI